MKKFFKKVWRKFFKPKPWVIINEQIEEQKLKIDCDFPVKDNGVSMLVKIPSGAGVGAGFMVKSFGNVTDGSELSLGNSLPCIGFENGSWPYTSQYSCSALGGSTASSDFKMRGLKNPCSDISYSFPANSRFLLDNPATDYTIIYIPLPELSSISGSGTGAQVLLSVPAGKIFWGIIVRTGITGVSIHETVSGNLNKNGANVWANASANGDFFIDGYASQIVMVGPSSNLSVLASSSKNGLTYKAHGFLLDV